MDLFWKADAFQKNRFVKLYKYDKGQGVENFRDPQAEVTTRKKRVVRLRLLWVVLSRSSLGSKIWESYEEILASDAELFYEKTGVYVIVHEDFRIKERQSMKTKELVTVQD